MEPAIRGGVGWHTGPNIEKARLLGRSIFVVKDVCRGDVLTTDNLRVIRPGHGMNPWQLIECIGRRATENIKAGTPLTLSMVGEI